ncbi:MAG TPA: DNA topoisomerase VI subunit B [Candidatus Binatia bacterium]|nr:DNA topoisomerase VI subunit B [Candidatus Binatia bacterium]
MAGKRSGAAPTAKKKGKAMAAQRKAAAGPGRVDPVEEAAAALDHEAVAAPRHHEPRKHRTAEHLASKQREISVSEFFAKNRHLLGFDNPRKALLTTVKEAVDNSLDACEEAGIVPEIWVAIEAVGTDRFRVSVQDNGPGIVKKQIPLIFGKLLYGSKFHRLRMSRGQQGIGISAAGMYGKLSTGKPVKIVSKTAPKKPAHYYEIEIDTKNNQPEIHNGKGEGVDIPPGAAGIEYMAKNGIEWVAHYDAEGTHHAHEVKSGTRVTIELEGRYQRGRGSVDEYLEQTAIANPHVTLHYKDPDGNQKAYRRSTDRLPPESKEIKPHPYGVELGRLVTMLKDTEEGSVSQFLQHSFSRVSPGTAAKICEAAKVSSRASAKKIGRTEVEHLYRAIQETRIPPPATDCITPIGEELILKGLHSVVPGEFFAAATRPPAVYRGNPFQLEVGLAYGGASTAAKKITLDALAELLSESDARTLRQFLINTFDGIGAEAADRIIKEAGFGSRQSPGKLKKKDVEQLHHAMQNVSFGEGQTMQVLRYANRVPLQFQSAACAITQAVMRTNWRAYGLTQSRSSLPSGPITIMVHMASVWVPFTSESKEAVASYPEIEKELRLAVQAVGRKLGMYMRRRDRVKQEGERRTIFLRYLGEVATAVAKINGTNRDKLYEQLLAVAKRKTIEADTKLDDRGRRIEEDEEGYGEHVLIVEPQGLAPYPADASATATGDDLTDEEGPVPLRGERSPSRARTDKKKGRGPKQRELPLA